MATFEQQLVKCHRIQPDAVSREIFRFIKTVSDYMVELNRQQIRKDSQDIYGNAIGFYSKASEFISGGKKKAGDPFTGEDTGEWLRGFYVTVLDDVFYFGSTDPKTDDILTSEHWLSADLFGLTDENLEDLIWNKIHPFVMKYYRKSLDL